MRIETNDRVDLAYRYAKAPGDLVDLLGREISELFLNRPQFVEHRDLLNRTQPGQNDSLRNVVLLKQTSAKYEFRGIIP